MLPSAFLMKTRTTPFSLFLPQPVPHLALQVPEESLSEYPDSMDTEPFLGRPYLPHPRPKAAYAAHDLAYGSRHRADSR